MKCYINDQFVSEVSELQDEKGMWDSYERNAF